MKPKILITEFQETAQNFYFSTPEYELLVKQTDLKIPFASALEIPELMKQMQKDGQLAGKMVVGAIPFDVSTGGCLYLTEQWEKNDIPFVKRCQMKYPPLQNEITTRQTMPTPAEYMKIVETGIKHIKAGLLDKIVLSRGMELTSARPFALLPILQRLYQNNTAGYTYAVPLEHNAYFMGASPEMLVSKREHMVFSNPLAGSRPRAAEFTRDQALAQELLQSAKDLQEHQLVVEDIVARLAAICQNVQCSVTPQLLQTKQLWHLSSHIQGDLIDPEHTVFDAVFRIHPTPAICGVPQPEAYRKILELEGRQRGVFTGLVGWCDETGDGDWAIAIRGAEFSDRKVLIKAGAGIVKDSVAKEEMAETGFKFQTMIDAIGVKE